MKMNRRDCVKASAGLLALITTLELEGCSVLDNLISWVPVGLAAFDGVASIVGGPFTAIAGTVDALWAAVQNAISLYQHSGDPTNSTLDKVIAALDALAGGLSQALAALPVSLPAGVLAASKAVLALTIATLKSIRDKLQPSTPAPAVYQAHAAVLVATPAKNKNDYIKQVNAIMAANGQTFRVK